MKPSRQLIKDNKEDDTPAYLPVESKLHAISEACH